MSKKLIVYLCLIFSAQVLKAQNVEHTIEFGPAGGIAFYLGDANRQPFVHNQMALGGVVRYCYNPRIATKLVMMSEKIAGKDNLGNSFSNSFFYLGLHGEFNFYNYELTDYVLESSPVTPYILGGVGLISTNVLAPVLTCGIGGKWKINNYLNLSLEWTINKAFTDNLEDVPSLNNPYQLNKSPWFNGDYFSSVTIALTFSFPTKRCDCHQGFIRIK
jgi:hypothetical protein